MKGKLPDRYIYPAVFHFDEDGISIEFPDLPGCLTAGFTLEEAYRMAQDALAGYLTICEEDGDSIPLPTLLTAIDCSKNEKIILVETWMPPYRDNAWDRAIKKTVTLPRWLERAGMEHKVNFSRLLQHALVEHLGLDHFEVEKETSSKEGQNNRTVE